jgi:hypothetical protein
MCGFWDSAKKREKKRNFFLFLRKAKVLRFGCLTPLGKRKENEKPRCIVFVARVDSYKAAHVTAVCNRYIAIQPTNLTKAF